MEEASTAELAVTPTLQPAAYLGGAGTSTSNDQFKTGSNYPNGGAAYFSTPAYTPTAAPTSETHFLRVLGPAQLTERPWIQGRGCDTGQGLRPAE